MFVSVKSDFYIKYMVKLIDLHMWKMHSERLLVSSSPLTTAMVRGKGDFQIKSFISFHNFPRS